MKFFKCFAKQKTKQNIQVLPPQDTYLHASPPLKSALEPDQEYRETITQNPMHKGVKK